MFLEEEVNDVKFAREESWGGAAPYIINSRCGAQKEPRLCQLQPTSPSTPSTSIRPALLIDYLDLCSGLSCGTEKRFQSAIELPLRPAS